MDLMLTYFIPLCHSSNCIYPCRWHLSQISQSWTT